jgi:hypothetical protein
MNARLAKSADHYRQTVGSPLLEAAAKFGRAAVDATSWSLPIELVLTLPSSSVIAALARDRLARGDRPLPLANVFWRSGRLFATVDFVGGRPSLFFALDVWTRTP